MTHEEYAAFEEIVECSYMRGYEAGLKAGRDGGYKGYVIKTWQR